MNFTAFGRTVVCIIVRLKIHHGTFTKEHKKWLQLGSSISHLWIRPAKVVGSSRLKPEVSRDVS